MSESSRDWAAPQNQGGTAIMIEHQTTLAPTITPEFDQACDTYNERLSWMLEQGWEGDWVAVSATTILGHHKEKGVLVRKHATLAKEKKLLLRVVEAPEPEYTIELW